MSGSTYKEWSAKQSPPSNIEFPKFQLPPPSGSSPVPVYPGNAFTLEGGVHTTGTPGSMQVGHAWVKSDDIGFDNVLLDLSFPVSIPLVSFSGALIPYSLSGYVYLYKDGNGYVAGHGSGSGGSSGKTTAEVYQKLDIPGINPISTNVTVSVVP